MKFHNHLRSIRQTTPLHQADIAFLTGKRDKALISRYENGKVRPRLKVILIYMILFDVSFRIIFRRQFLQAIAFLLNRIEERVAYLESKGDEHERIAYLKHVRNRLYNMYANK